MRTKQANKRSESKSDRGDIYTRVTHQIIESLEKGVRPWMKPWANGRHVAGCISRPLRFNGTPYRGINVLMLWHEADLRGFVSPYFLTFAQSKALGGCVKKGEHGMRVVYANTYTRKEVDDAGEEVEYQRGFLKEFVVFNSEQVSGLPSHYYQLVQESRPKIERIEQAREFFANTKADIRMGGNRAFYSPSEDYIQMPPLDSFRDAESFEAVLGHETVHWSKAPERLNRDFGGKRFGDRAYCVEELVAEIGSAFLCADLGITPEIRDDHSAYIQSWLAVLRGDSRAVFAAAAHAAKAVEFLHGLQPKSEHKENDETHQEAAS